VDEVYKSLIANGRKSNSASMVAQSYSSYVAWKDSVNALKLADETGALKQRIAECEATIAEKDSSLASRKMVIIGLCVVVVALAAVIVVGGLVLLRFIFLTRKQKKTIKLANENNALKAKFISNISAQLNPALQKLDRNVPEVKALQDFSDHVQMLSELECATDESLQKEDTQVAQLCEGLMDEIRSKVKPEVELKVNVQKMNVMINQKYVTHILRHLLSNAAEYAPEGGHITLDFKKRSVHKYQFLILNTGSSIPEEQQENVFKAFLEIKDLTKGDGLGLPICKQMALKMDGDLTIDPTFTKGTRFILDLHA
jgi:signal transduction histidine kinase